MPAAASTSPTSPAGSLRRLLATRYVTALREGGSVPAVVEADDGALYVAKFRAAAQGGRALAAELIVGELARAAGLRLPELALIEIDAALGRSEPHQEIQELLIASAGLNLAMGYLSGAVGYDVAARRSDRRRARLADRGARPLRGQRRPHRAQPESALAGGRAVAHRSRRRAVLAPRLGRQRTEPRADRVGGAGRSGASESTCCCPSPITARGGRRAGGGARRCAVARAVDAVPELWLEGPGADRLRAAYGTWLRARRAALPNILDEANRVRASRI